MPHPFPLMLNAYASFVFFFFTGQGKNVPVKEGKVRLALLQASEQLAELEKAESKDAASEISRKLEVYQKVLASYDDALQALKEEMREVEKGLKGGSATKVTTSALNQLKDYITFR